ncbi:cobalt ECF transporter T component CbiQ [Segnochrobactraceae bacterium EtOH-i3]
MSAGTLVQADSGGALGTLDPRCRLLGAVAGVVVIAGLHRPAAIASALGLGLLLALLARLPARPLLRRLAHLEGFLLLLLVLLPLTMPGPALVSLGPLALSELGLARALGLIGRITAATLMLAALLGPLEPTRIGAAAARLKLPPALVTLFLLTVRYAALFGDEARRLGEAMRVRGFVPRASVHGWRSLGAFLGMLLVRALDRAERVTEAMRCRGWAGRMPVSDHPPFTWADGVFAALLTAALLALVVLERLPEMLP